MQQSQVPEFPQDFPGAWQNIPVDVRRMLTQKLVDKALQIHEGPEGLIKWLYAGVKQPTLSVAETYRLRGRDFWPLVVEDTKVWLAARVGGGK